MRKVRVALVLVLGVLLAGGTVWADRDFAPVPQTGQVLCYDVAGTQIDCTDTGQDGALQKGAEIPTPRYKDRGNGTIKDNLTGLVWLKNANCPNGRRTWQQALNDVKDLNATGKMNGHNCGDTSGKKGSHRTDWRLPNVRELFSLIDYAFSFPAISNVAGTGQGSSDDPFTDLQQAGYWSSTSFAGFPDEAWVVDITDGFVGTILKELFNAVGGYVLAVRGDS